MAVQQVPRQCRSAGRRESGAEYLRLRRPPSVPVRACRRSYRNRHVSRTSCRSCGSGEWRGSATAAPEGARTPLSRLPALLQKPPRVPDLLQELRQRRMERFGDRGAGRSPDAAFAPAGAPALSAAPPPTPRHRSGRASSSRSSNASAGESVMSTLSRRSAGPSPSLSSRIQCPASRRYSSRRR